MACPQCGTSNRAGAKFCVECGSALAATCPSCGSPIEAGAKFCPECGTRLAPGGALASGALAAATADAEAPTGPRGVSAGTPAVVATERRLVSVLFADLVGFTTLAEGRDSEAVRDLLARYFERASEIVERYGGTVEKFIGDAVMAVWGTPIVHEDDAERAVRAALDLVDAVRALGGEAEVGGLDARAGVLTGEAAVTIGARNQGMVAGDLVNTASRLQASAAPGMVLVGEATRRAAEGAIAFEPVGEQVLRGKSAPIAAFRALRVVATVGGALRADALEPPFVGRETEFRLLRELFHATGRERRARLVSLTGQAGIGKSRLGWEFQKYLDGIREELWWHHGRSPAYGEGVTFWALGEMVRKRAGLAESDDEATSRRRVAEAVAAHVADLGEQAFVEPALLALLGLDEPPPGGRDRLFAGWRLFFERLSEASTVVLVFEDLQWADDGLLDFIEHLLEWSRSYPILVVTLARPELLDRRPTWGLARGASSLALGPLDDLEMRQLLAGLVPGLPEAAVRSILARADGIPLYAVETVRMLVADGRLEAAGEGRFRPAARLDELEVPATLQALIAARLDGLESSDRALLQDASVLGKTFTVEALAAVRGIAPDELAAPLRSLVARELLALDTDPASPERGQYGFVQALIREVAYGTLARRERRSRHLAAARYFEARGDEELAPLLASHYLSAYRAMPEGPEGEAIRAQARVALRAAADRAMSLGAYDSAVTYLEQALELGTGESREEADLLGRAGQAAVLNGQYERAEGLLTRALARARESADPLAIAQVTADLSLALMAAGKGDQALELLKAARLEFAAPGHEVPRALVVNRIAQLYVRRGIGAPALEAAEEVLPIAERHRLHQVFVDALTSKASALGQLGRDLEGVLLVEGAQRIAAARGFVAEQMRAMTNAVVQQIDQDPWRAYELGFEAIDQARRFGVRPTLIFCVLNATEAAIRVGEWSRAGEVIESVLALDLEPTDRLMLLAAGATLGEYQGRRDERRVAELEQLAAEHRDGPGRGVTNDYRLVRAHLEGRYDEAHRLAMEGGASDDLNGPWYYERATRAALWMGDLGRARQALEAFEALGRAAPLPAAQLVGARASVLALEGRRDEALAAYRELARRLRELRTVFDLAVGKLDETLAVGSATPEGAAAAGEARAVFERLEARPFLARLDGLVALTPGRLPQARAAEVRSQATPA